MNIPFNKPFLTGKEAHYLYQSVYSGKISGNGIFTKKCQQFFEEKYGFKKTLLTTSCTDALEMAAILADIQADDEIIIPSYTFVSSALAFVRQVAKIIFADSYEDQPNLDVSTLESLITSRTKAIVPVHYAGVACDMDAIMKLAEKYNLIVIEDAAQAVDSFYKNRPLGGIGHLSAFSFHETKNIMAGEGGMLVINDDRYLNRAEIIWEKGTNRAEFFRGEVNKYGWVDTGSSFLPSDILAAFLYAQLENLDIIQSKRREIWDNYHNAFLNDPKMARVGLPIIPDYATNNSHMYYLVCADIEERSALIEFLKQKGILAVFHYLSLHKSPYYSSRYTGNELKNSDHFSDCLVRLPMFFELTSEEQTYIINAVKSFYQKRN